ncbi:MAG: 2TM domain-containing protein [Armatimonadota bacterium]
MRQTFQQEEAEQILQEAVRREVHQAPEESVSPAISHERLLAMAEELGITPAALESVLQDRQVQAKREQEQTMLAQLRREFITERRAGFLPHLYAYIGVNFLFFAINFLTRVGYPWFLWPLLFWSIALYFHAIFSLPTRGPNFERSFSRWRERQTKREQKEAKRRAEESARAGKTEARVAAEAELDQL